MMTTFRLYWQCPSNPEQTILMDEHKFSTIEECLDWAAGIIKDRRHESPTGWLPMIQALETSRSTIFSPTFFPAA